MGSFDLGATPAGQGGNDGESGCTDDLASILSQRVSYETAARMLCVSVPQLRTLIRDGHLPVIQPATGRRAALIEVRALHELLQRWRAQAQREATARAKSVAAKRGAV